MPQYPNPHAPGCPWYDVTEVVGAPNLKWCEPTRCEWISEPANTWSNLGYLAVAVVFWRLARSARSVAVRLFAPTAFLMGLFSFVYHASNNYLTQVFDFVGMFLYVYLLVRINLVRVWPGLRTWQRPIYWGLILGSTGLVHGMYLLDLPYQLLIAIGVLVLVVTEVICMRRGDWQRYRYRYFGLSLLIIVVAESFSLLDVSRTWCQPENLILHGHAIWHVLGSVSILFAFLHYRQLDLDA
ncbi:MAG: ceramidase domain-containing protein [Pseudomonadota bacterium]